MVAGSVHGIRVAGAEGCWEGGGVRGGLRTYGHTDMQADGIVTW